MFSNLKSVIRSGLRHVSASNRLPQKSWNPAYGSGRIVKFQPPKNEAEIEQSTNPRGGIYKTVIYCCRLQLNYPPTAVGGIPDFEAKAPNRSEREGGKKRANGGAN